MEDLIRRSDAIKAMQECFQVLARQRVQAVKMIEAIPSADNEIIGKLKTAIENEEICKKCPTAERMTGENLLGAMALGFSYGMDADRPQGEWIIEVDANGNTYGRCPICGMRQYAGQINFCPECGSDMRKRSKK